MVQKRKKKNNVFNGITVEFIAPENIDDDFVHLNYLKVMVQVVVKFDYIRVI